MSPGLPSDPSRLRQLLAQTIERWTQLIQAIQAERGPMIRGTFMEVGRRCGRPGCRCAQGELHPTAMVSAKVVGRTTNAYVPVADREHVRQLTLRYRRLRRARADLAKLTRRTLQLVDALQEALTQPYPPPDRGAGGRRRSGS